jgi:hypothetical protein
MACRLAAEMNACTASGHARNFRSRALLFFALSTCLCATAELHADDQVEKAVRVLTTLCVSGGTVTHVDYSKSQFSMESSRGSVSVVKGEAQGLVDGIGTKLTGLAADQADKARECMRPYLEQVLAMLTGKDFHPQASYQRSLQQDLTTSFCGSMAISNTIEQTGNDSTPYDVHFDFTRGKEQLDRRACGREVWITSNKTHALFGIKFVYLIDGYKRRTSDQLYVEKADGSLSVY